MQAVEAPLKPPLKRRPHHKSRHGCQQCKQRKIKCDEKKPQCDKCTRSNSQCSFQGIFPHPYRSHILQSKLGSAHLPIHVYSNQHNGFTSPYRSSEGQMPSPTSLNGLSNHNSYQSSPQYTTSPTNNSFNATNSLTPWDSEDMELLWNFSQKTCYSLQEVGPLPDPERKVWTEIIPQMGMKNEYVMHGILALSAIHLAHDRPSERSRLYALRDKHIERGIAQYRIVISSLNSQYSHACFAFSVLLVMAEKPGARFNIASMQAGLGIVGLLRGALTVIHPFTEDMKSGPLAGVYESWTSRLAKPQPPNESDGFRLRQMTQYWNPSISHYTPSQARILHESYEKLVECFGLLSSQNDIPDLACALSWIGTLSFDFMSMIAAQDVGALILLGHFCVLLHRIRACWWIEDEGKGLLGQILALLGPRNEHWVRWPVQEVGI